MKYTVVPGTISTVVLPRFVEGTSGTLLAPRSDTPLATVRAPCEVVAMNRDMLGKVASTQRLEVGNFHVVPQVGHAYEVSQTLVEVPGTPNPSALFRLGEPAEQLAHRTIVPVMSQFWSERCGEEVEVYELFRTQPAYVLGEVSPDADPGMLMMGRTYSARVSYEGWSGDRLLLICEMPREGELCTYHGLRLVPLTYLVREFASWHADNGKIIELFQVSPT